LAANYSKVVFVHFLSQCGKKEKSSKKETRKGSVEIWRVKVPHRTIRSQLYVKVTLWRVLAFENDNVFSPILPMISVLVK
jgi:hypothetical protein